MDRITQSLLAAFVSENELGSLAPAEAFEHFGGFLVTSSHHSETFSTDDIAVGGGGDAGIDCIAIQVNGCLVTEPEEIQDLEQTNGYLDVSFLFVQAETSPNFESAKIGQFGFGVKDFFSESPRLPQNERLELRARIANEILKRSARFSKGNPRCHLYYVTTGTWKEDRQLVTRQDAVINDLRTLNIFRDVSFRCIGARELQELYRQSQNAIATEITFTQKTPYPEIPGVKDAYMGLLPSTEFLKLVQGTNDEMRTNLFFDNVRDWQEWNQVNSEIKQTLRNSVTRVQFPLLNNGVTIVARRVSPTANKLLLEDYQIVNGCQTSNVLHEMRGVLNVKIMVPVRIIATDDETIKNAIIKATNRQTAVQEHEFFALSEFPKRLESYFPTFDGKKKLFYERRSRQFAAEKDIEKVRVINMTTLVRSFASMFLELPHRTTRNYKALLKDIGVRIFNPDHKLEPYYVAGYAYYKLEYLFRRQVLASELKPAKYHLLLGLRLLANGKELPPYNSNEMTRYCDVLMGLLWNEERCVRSFCEASRMVERVANGNMHRDNIRTETFTNQFTASLSAQHNAMKVTSEGGAQPRRSRKVPGTEGRAFREKKVPS